MGKATAVASTASSGKAKRPISADIIGKKRPASAATTSSASQKKKTAVTSSSGSTKKAPPLPRGWPVSSKSSYPAPRDDDDDDGRRLRPGGLLRRSCNGSDVFLRKRAVQPASASLPSAVMGGGLGGPSRFLIVFPGRVSLRAPVVASSTAAGERDATSVGVGDGEGGGAVADDDGPNDDDDDVVGEESARKAGRGRNPFAPAHPPRLLGRLVSSSGGRVELRIPFPAYDDAPSSSSPDGENDRDPLENVNGDDPTTAKRVGQLVMSGRAIPISGKFMALSFKRTGGAKDSASSGGGNGKNKKTGTGSITCKDVFRSVIVLGDSKLLDGNGKAAPLEANPATKAEDYDDDENRATMKHYGGSERAVDGGGRYDEGLNSGRKSSLGRTTEAVAKRKDSVSSKEIDLESDASKDFDVGDGNDGDSSDVDEFVPISKKRKSTEGPKKCKAMIDSDDDDEEEITPARKRAPRRSVTAAKVSYVDEGSDSDLDGADSDDETVESGSNEESGEEGGYRPKYMPKAIQSDAKKVVSKPAAATATNGVASKKRYEFKDNLEDRKPKVTPKAKIIKVSNRAADIKGSAKKATSAAMKKSNDIIEIDSDEEDGKTMSVSNKRHEVDEQSLQRISADATKRLSTMSPASKSPSKSPISHGRRKKNSPKNENEPNKRKDIDLNWDDDDDPFTFL